MGAGFSANMVAANRLVGVGPCRELAAKSRRSPSADPG